MTEDNRDTNKKNWILKWTMRLAVVAAGLAVLIPIKLFPYQSGEVIGWLMGIGMIVYCFFPKAPKVKNTHTITIKRG